MLHPSPTRWYVDGVDDQSTILWWRVSPYLNEIPVVSDSCTLCGRPVSKDDVANEVHHVYRRWGDSRYGYEVIHTWCSRD